MRLILIIVFLTTCTGCVVGKGNIRVEYPNNSGEKIAVSIDLDMVR